MIRLIAKNVHTVGALLITILLSGCVHPKVTYISHPNPELDDPQATKLMDDYEGNIKFRLAATRVVLGEKKADPQDPKKTYTDINTKIAIGTEKVSTLVVPREDESAVYAVVPQSQWLWMVETKLSVTYFDNSRLIQKIGMQVEDNRIKIIQAIGSVVSAIAAVAFSPTTINIPVAIDIDPDQAGWKDLPGNPGWFYLLEKTEKEPDAVERGKYFEKYSDGFFFYVFIDKDTSYLFLPTNQPQSRDQTRSRDG